MEKKNNVILVLSLVVVILLMLLLNKPKSTTEIKFIPVKENIAITDKEDIKIIPSLPTPKIPFIYVPTVVVIHSMTLSEYPF